MPIYEFRCSTCDTHFELRRPATDSDAAPPACPAGHDTTRRVLSVFATTGRSGGEAGPAGGGSPFGGSGSGGGCGPGCACAANA